MRTPRNWNIFLMVTAFILVVMKSCPTSSGEKKTAPLYEWDVVNVFPHDTDAFTQGLIYRDGHLYESTGRRGRSDIRKVDLITGEIIKRKPLEDQYFGEGLTELNGRLIQLTLSSGKGFVYDMETFAFIRSFEITGEGWGLTNNGTHLIMSDGTSTLRFLDPETFEVSRQLTVTEFGEPVVRLNELEMIGDTIFANILFSNQIVMINSENGEVIGRIDLEELVSAVKQDHTIDVLNGIAYDSENDKIYITGKLWPNLFEIKVDFVLNSDLVNH